jgi:hypothetical protein
MSIAAAHVYANPANGALRSSFGFTTIGAGAGTGNEQMTLEEALLAVWRQALEKTLQEVLQILMRSHFVPMQSLNLGPEGAKVL